MYGYNWSAFECALYIKWGNKALPLLAALPCYPEAVSESLSTTWSPTTIVGRPGALYSYTTTSDISCSFSFDLHREMERPGTIIGKLYAYGTYTDGIIRAIKSACYPKFSYQGVEPPRTTWRFGDTYISGILMDAGFDWKLPIVDKKYSVCTVSVQMVNVHTKITDADDVLNPFVVSTRGSGRTGGITAAKVIETAADAITAAGNVLSSLF